MRVAVTLRFLITFVTFGAWCQCFVDAWGTEGHEIVANLAWKRLEPKTQEWVARILNITDPEDGNSPLGAVADWADRVRHFMPWSAGLHYIDVRDDLIPGGCHASSPNEDCSFQYERDCVDDACVAGAIVNYTRQLVNTRQVSTNDEPTPKIRRRWPLEEASNFDTSTSIEHALMFLTHFVGDIHQPLHCSRTTDKGGNDFHVHFSLLKSAPPEPRNYHVSDSPLGKSHHKSWNLHSVWDTGLIEVALQRDYNDSRVNMEDDFWETIVQYPEKMKKYVDCPGGGLNPACPILWGEESWQTALYWSYTVDEARSIDVENGSNLTESYYTTRWPLVKDRLIAGAVRLAATLEAIMKASSEPKAHARKEDLANHVGSLVGWSHYVLRSE